MKTFNQLEVVLEDEYIKLELELIQKELKMLKAQQQDAYRRDLRKRHKGEFKKHYLIRESDISKITGEVRKKYSITFKPLTQEYFERRSTFFYLKGKKYLGDQYALNPYPRDMICRISNIILWDTGYLNWLIRYNDDGELAIRAGLRMRESRLGLGVFKEKQ